MHHFLPFNNASLPPFYASLPLFCASVSLSSLSCQSLAFVHQHLSFVHQFLFHSVLYTEVGSSVCFVTLVIISKRFFLIHWFHHTYAFKRASHQVKIDRHMILSNIVWQNTTWYTLYRIYLHMLYAGTKMIQVILCLYSINHKLLIYYKLTCCPGEATNWK